jgi:glycosyltransferase involved in cell wall biosynthesis
MQKHIVPFAALDASEMANELQNAHVFALPSLIENSPNSLAESMLIGTPAVASYVGGVPSMARDEESVLFFPPDDEAVLAEQIRRIFLDDGLARRLSEGASAVARARHSKDRIVKDMLAIYAQESRQQS